MLLRSGRHIGGMVDVVKIISNTGRKREERAAKRQQDHLHHTRKEVRAYLVQTIVFIHAHTHRTHLSMIGECSVCVCMCVL